MKKTMQTLLALLVLAQTMTACSGDGGTSAVDTGNAGAETAAQTTEAVDPRIQQKADYYATLNRTLPDEPITITFISDTGDIAVEAENGEKLNDAMYRRNIEIEEKLGYKIVDLPEDSEANTPTKVKQSVMSGDGAYDVVSTRTYMIASMFSGSYLRDLNEFSALQLDQPWWNQTANQNMSFGGVRYCGLSALCHRADTVCELVMMNKRIAEDLDLEIPYQAVRDGEWTWEMMHTMMKQLPTDSNGDGKMDVNDTWGYATNFGYHALTWAYAIGEMGVTLTDDGVELGYRSEKFATLSDWLYDLLYTSKLAFEIGWDLPCDISWDENRVLIQAIWLNDLEKFREYESAYGLLPYPMYDETQEKYYTYDDCRHATFGIPLTSPTENIEKTGLLLEALSADSYHNLIPKYLDSVVTFKLSRDEDSLEMLDYIMDGRVYDIGYAMPDAKRYSWIISEQLKNSKGTLTSTTERFTKIATKHYEKLLESYKTMSEMEW